MGSCTLDERFNRANGLRNCNMKCGLMSQLDHFDRGIELSLGVECPLQPGKRARLRGNAYVAKGQIQTHAPLKWDRFYSITSSARARTFGGISRPSVLAVLRLMTSSKRVGCSIGRSPGLEPFKILSTYDAARRHIAVLLEP
jgi:hypothetical protein